MYESVNWLAVVVAGAINIGINALWYGPVFGKQWMAMMGFTPDSMKSMKLTPMQAMAGGAVTSLLMAFVLSQFAMMLGTMGAAGAVKLAFWVWLGFVATVQAGAFLWENRSLKLFLFNAAASLITFIAMALVVVLWK